MKRKLASGRAEARCEKRGLQRDGRGAFTLIELLVVIAVIAILVSVLLPALNRARAAGRSAVCKSNLHQIALAIKLYSADFGAYPLYVSPQPIPPPWAGSFSPAQGAADYWPDQLKPYTHDISGWGGLRDSSYLPPGAPHSGPVSWYKPSVFVCPDYYSPALYGSFSESSLFNYNPEELIGAYGYNAMGMTGVIGNPPTLMAGQLGLGGSFNSGSIYQWPTASFQVRACGESSVLSPASMRLVGDANLMDVGGIAGMGYLDFHVGGTDPYNPGHNPYYPFGPIDWEARRHNGQFNCAYCDGHVAGIRRSRFFDHQDPEMLRQWNNDNQPHAELVFLGGQIPY